jgi:esterase/lipase superfamily enzyme
MGGIAGLGSFFSGIRSGAGNALNMIPYYKMKARAGTVGRKGLAPVLRQVKEEKPTIRIHLAGHSFGGRLVAATALGESDTAEVLPIDSMTLLQAAFSHHGFAEDWDGTKDGYFRDVYTENRISGPTIVTYTSNDKANRVAYPLASRLARQVAAAFGDANDKYGAIGANGAQNTPEAVAGTLLERDGVYDFEPGVVYNLEGSAYIANHGDVAGREIANAMIAAINAT